MAQHWEPCDDLTAQEKILLKTVEKTKRLFGLPPSIADALGRTRCGSSCSISEPTRSR